jgi:hypothetical protein
LFSEITPKTYITKVAGMTGSLLAFNKTGQLLLLLDKIRGLYKYVEFYVRNWNIVSK